MKATFLILFTLISILCYSQENKIDVDQLITETQTGSKDPNDMEIIWWIPVEFWIAVLQAEESLPDKQVAEMISVLEPYSIFAIVDGKVGPFGGVTYTPLEQISKTITLIGKNENKYKPISFEDLNSDTQVLISTFKPLLKNMLGELGENMHFFVFPDKDNKKNRISDPKSHGNVKLHLNGTEYIWKTPLASLTPPKICPVDNEKVNGSWNYCPWHGGKLIEDKL